MEGKINADLGKCVECSGLTDAPDAGEEIAVNYDCMFRDCNGKCLYKEKTCLGKYNVRACPHIAYVVNPHR